MKRLVKSEQWLRIYLDDHVALMIGELELIRRCQHSNRSDSLGDYLEKLHIEVKAQRSIVKDVLYRLDGKDSRIKGAGAWLAEKLGRFKLNGTLLTYSDLSRLVELETLAVAALERISAWDNLSAIARCDARLAGITFDFFHQQSQGHLEELTMLRRRAAARAFSLER